nr:hypothetical protein [uncultured Carboxylicivirga sp.]
MEMLEKKYVVLSCVVFVVVGLLMLLIKKDMIGSFLMGFGGLVFSFSINKLLVKVLMLTFFTIIVILSIYFTYLSNYNIL